MDQPTDAPSDMVFALVALRNDLIEPEALGAAAPLAPAARRWPIGWWRVGN